MLVRTYTLRQDLGFCQTLHVSVSDWSQDYPIAARLPAASVGDARLLASFHLQVKTQCVLVCSSLLILHTRFMKMKVSLSYKDTFTNKVKGLYIMHCFLNTINVMFDICLDYSLHHFKDKGQ